MTRALLCSASIATLLFAAPAFAQPAPDPDVAGRAGATAVDTLVITANRSPQPMEKVAASVTVLNKDAIEQIQSPDLVQLLAETPSVSYARNGGPGTVAGVYIRGAETFHTVLVVDGVKLADVAAPQGGANFGNLLIGDVSRIEVLRGAQSTLWGSQAIGGVVNIVTADATGPFQGSLDLEGGSLATAYLRAGLGGTSERITWRLAGGFYRTDGFSAVRGGAEDDAYENRGLAGRVRLALTDSISFETRAVWSDGQADFDGFGVDSNEYGVTKERVIYAGLNASLLDGRFKNRLGYSFSDTDRENFNPDDPAVPVSFQAYGETRRVEYQGSLAVTDAWSVVFGAESENSGMRTRAPWTFDPDPAFTRGKSGVDSLFAQVQGDVAPGLTVTAGLRQDSHDIYGDHTLGSLAAAWTPNDGDTIVRTSIGQGFRAPALYELFSEYGNTALSPDESTSWEIGVEQRLGVSTVSATWFRREADNEIRFYNCAFGSPEPLCNPGGLFRFGYYENVQKTQTQGLELVGRTRIDNLTLVGNYTWTDAKNASGVNDGNSLARRPEHLANLSATWRWSDEVSATAAVRYVGESFTSEANTATLDGYVLVDLRASWQVSEVVELHGRVENLLDEDYQTAAGYGTPGRGAYVGVRARF
jgi:vitamin B12 transporter